MAASCKNAAPPAGKPGVHASCAAALQAAGAEIIWLPATTQGQPELPALNDLATTLRWQLCEAQPLGDDVRLRQSTGHTRN